MKFLLRADGDSIQGTGHVMRCLTIGEALVSRGHTVELMTNRIDVPWLADAISQTGMPWLETEIDDLSPARIEERSPDWVVADSYRFDPGEISRLNERIPVLALIDGDDRGVRATVYLDQNVGAELLPHSAHVARSLLAGAEYALVRDAILEQRRGQPWQPLGRLPSVLSFMGGSDSTGASVAVARALSPLLDGLELTVIAPESLHAELVEAFGEDRRPTIISPTAELPRILGTTDIVLSAAGTSAWDVCALGIPSVLVAVVDNQLSSLQQAEARALALAIDAVTDPGAIERELAELVNRLTASEELRRSLSDACLSTIDGLGKVRVVERLEQLTAQHGGSHQ